jgi:hypothetical protein
VTKPPTHGRINIRTRKRKKKIGVNSIVIVVFVGHGKIAPISL